MDALVRVPGIKRIFFGDIRSHPLNKQFAAGRALRELGDNATKDGVSERMTQIEDREEELLVHPMLFTGLKHRLPELVEHVEILPKRMQATNELSAYRYAAVVDMSGVSKKKRHI